ncbi:hypothetical protein M5D96_013631 [Drosophila gunungcola]|uniref:Uncharacterized protein n=1 Tax=Drosophila gunungcola TaxID=103775 RepID=A0A9P9YAX6_9MUSC|nr:hypothetical protein M5D96_013631 [Drosophila gunungcola]
MNGKRCKNPYQKVEKESTNQQKEYVWDRCAALAHTERKSLRHQLPLEIAANLKSNKLLLLLHLFNCTRF